MKFQELMNNQSAPMINLTLSASEHWQFTNKWKGLPRSKTCPGCAKVFPAVVLSVKMTRLVYNRIAKAGSTTMIALIVALSKLNNFTVKEEVRYSMTNTTLYNTLVSLPNNSVYINHCNYVETLPDDFVWINMMREPIDRAQSMFYYGVSPTRSKEKVMQALNDRKRDKLCGCAYHEFDKCFHKRYLEPKCSDKLTLELPASMYFQAAKDKPDKSNNSTGIQWTPVQAFKRVKDNYVIVGLDEEFELSIRMFEKLLPRFFRNATAVYRQMKESGRSNKNRTPEVNPLTHTSQSGAVSTFVRGVLTHHNPEEVEFYERVKRLFWWKVAQFLPEEINFENMEDV